MRVEENENVNDFLEHFGVKGMKWGVRKNYNELRNRERQTIELTTSSGKKITLVESRVSPISAGVGAISKRTRENINNSRSFVIKADGENVGQTALRHVSKDELNLEWMGVNPQHRGKGYATAVFEAGVTYAKQQGYSRITLEVPGDAPDARHIYDKFGFKDTGKVFGEEGDFWGGLTQMEYRVKKASA